MLWATPFRRPVLTRKTAVAIAMMVNQRVQLVSEDVNHHTKTPSLINSHMCGHNAANSAPASPPSGLAG